MSDIVVRVENVSKSYRIGVAPEKYATLRDAIVETIKSPLKRIQKSLPTGKESDSIDEIWALKNVSFEVERGQVLGVIGRNGAGKSTLLKILSRITEPTEGHAQIRGRVGSLLEVGTGFHPELTGRENIYLNGAILGMKRAVIERKFDEMVAFSGVEKFIDTPVKRYSSGMYLRLAFSVAAHLEPEILVVDEVLAVGDAEFQRKCLGKMSAVAQEGRTVLFVSHDMSAISRLTEETIVLEEGNLVYRAPTQKAVDYYMSTGFSKTGERAWKAEEIPLSSAPFHPFALRVKNSKGQVVDLMRSTEPITIEVEYKLNKPIQALRVGIYLRNMQGVYVFTSFDTDSPEEYESFATRPAGHYVSHCVIPADTLNEGRYSIGINAGIYRGGGHFFQDLRALVFNVDGMGAPGKQWAERRRGVIRPRLDWEINQID